jgi:hypothetical protein
VAIPLRTGGLSPHETGIIFLVGAALWRRGKLLLNRRLPRPANPTNSGATSEPGAPVSQRQGLWEKFIEQILPFRVEVIDQIQFFLARTCFDLLFPKNCNIYIITTFIIHKFRYIVALGKNAFAGSVFQDPAL